MPSLSVGAADSPVTASDSSRAITFGIDARDYNEAAKELAESILADKKLSLDNTKVLVLGPVDDDSCVYRFDALKLQEKLQTILLQSGMIRVSFAVDAMKDNSAAQARYGVMRLQWEKESAVDPEDLKTFGTLAKVDYLLFGRLSAQTVRKSKETEATHTFNWKIGNCEDGLLVWAHEKEIAKNGATPAVPEWITDARSDSASYLYEIGRAVSADKKQALEDAAKDARSKFAQRINASFPIDAGLILPAGEDQFPAMLAPQGEYVAREGDGHSVWRLMRVSRDVYAGQMEKRQAALNMWQEAGKSSGASRKELLRSIIYGFPIGAQSFVQTEHAVVSLAEMEEKDNQLLAAQNWYKHITEHSASDGWRNKAEELLRRTPLTPEETAWRREFEGRRIRVSCAYEADGRKCAWPKISNELLTHFHGMGAEAEAASDGSPRATSGGDLQQPAAGKEPDFTLSFTATGKLNKRANEKSPVKEDCQFAGEIECTVVAGGKPHFSDNYKGVGGWNPMGEDMCMEVLALTSMNRWKTKYLEHLGVSNLP